MTTSRPAYVAEVVRLYLDDPDTPIVPTSADWDIAGTLFDRQVPIENVRLAFKLAFLRRKVRTSDQALPPIKSLAYFRTVVLNLSAEETEPAYADYVDRLYEQLRPAPGPAPQNTSTDGSYHGTTKTAP